jgi:chromosome partitioning protein
MPLDYAAIPVALEVTPEDLLSLADRSGKVLNKVRNTMLEPFPRKNPPIFPSNKVSHICGIDKNRMNNLLKTGKLPAGSQEAPRSMRQFTLAETIEWVKATRDLEPRLDGEKGKVLAVGNFKGGVTKTTTSMMLGQGLSLRCGRKVLLIDLDPQGSTTTLFGINPHAEVEVDQTVFPAISQERENLVGIPQKTYWDNLDLIPSSTDLFNAEFILPAQVQSGGSKYEFWNVLAKAIEPLRDEYDYIIIDTAPTLSYLTINALFAADGIIVPVVPDLLSFTSMVQFWSLFSDLVKGMANRGASNRKTFSYIDILITRLPNKKEAMAMRDLIVKTYGDHVLQIAIPETALAMSTSSEFATVYDSAKWEGSAEAYRRICDPYDQLVDLIDYKTSQLWAKDRKRNLNE